MKLSLTTMLAIMVMLLLLAVHTAASPLTIPSGSDWNIDTAVTAALIDNPTFHTYQKPWATTTGSESTFVTMTSSEVSTATATSDPMLELVKKQSHDYFIDCQPFTITITNLMDTSLSRTCLGAPYAYTCTSRGQLLYNVKNPICDTQCKCRKALQCPKAAIPVGIPCLLGIGSNPPGAAGGGLDEIDNGGQGDSHSGSIGLSPTASSTNQGDIATHTPTKPEKRDVAAGTPANLEKRNKYSLSDNIGDLNLSRKCAALPYDYQCNDSGGLVCEKADEQCSADCHCYGFIAGSVERETDHKHKKPTKTLPAPITVAQTISIRPEPQRTKAAIERHEAVDGTVGTPQRRAAPGETIVCKDGGTILPVPGQEAKIICDGEVVTILGETVVCAHGGTLVPVPGKQPNIVCTGGEIVIASTDLDTSDKTFFERYAFTAGDELDEI